MDQEIEHIRHATAEQGVLCTALSLGDGWECAALPAGSIAHPEDLVGAAPDWVPAQVPGTVAGALRSVGRPVRRDDLDRCDWWFRLRFTGRPGPWLLELGGVATLGDAWLNGNHLVHSENMFRSHLLPVDLLPEDNDLFVRCSALAPVLAARRPRPRWKTYLVEEQNLRWVRTSLLGRIPGWAVVPPVVGPWRPVRLLSLAPGAPPASVSLRATCDGDGDGGGGVVEAAFVLRGVSQVRQARLRVESSEVELSVRQDGNDLALEGVARLPSVHRWWPHTHGPQPLYEVWVEVDGRSHRLGKVGFRTLGVDRRDGAFRIEVNGEPIFCRGACWMPVDPVSLVSSESVVDHRLALVRAAHMNMLRVPGTTVYQDRRFFERCDELGILVWHDCMFAFMDPPSDQAFTQDVEAEVAEALATMGGHPSLAVVCGNQEIEEVAAMNGLEGGRSTTPLFDETIPRLAERILPGVPYVTSNPTGGDLPFRMNSGISQYFGVGGYLRPIEDARRAGVRFAAECLAFATPPEPETVEEVCGGAYRAGHDPSWKEGVHHDSGRSWDMEDVRDHYVASLFGADPLMERYLDAERALELGRATNAQLMGAVMAEWRRPGSSCGGGLVLSMADLRAGAGWGLVDVLGRPKAPWYVLRRVFQPVALLAVDEGLNGVDLHVVNDSCDIVRGRLVVELVARGELFVERGEVTVVAGPRDSWSINAEAVLGGFRDLSYAYRFSPPAHDAVVATLWSDDDLMLSQVVHLPLGQARALEADLGLSAVARPAGPGRWELEVRTARLAQWVTIRAPGFLADDSWFHLPPGGRRMVALCAEGSTPPRGTVQALNAARRAAIKVDELEER
jgi:beta-mannosidase